MEDGKGVCTEYSLKAGVLKTCSSPDPKDILSVSVAPDRTLRKLRKRTPELGILSLLGFCALSARDPSPTGPRPISGPDPSHTVYGPDADLKCSGPISLPSSGGKLMDAALKKQQTTTTIN